MQRLLSGLLVLLLCGCASRRDSKIATPPPAMQAAALLQVDREFARLAGQRGPAEAFGLVSDQRSVRITPVGPNTVGREAFVAELRDLPPGSLTWTPQYAEVSLAGDLGWTWGDYVLRTERGNRRGRYVTVWRRTPMGWKIAADIGAPELPAPAP